MTEQQAITKVLNLARSEIGYKEKDQTHSQIIKLPMPVAATGLNMLAILMQ